MTDDIYRYYDHPIRLARENAELKKRIEELEDGCRAVMMRVAEKDDMEAHRILKTILPKEEAGLG